MSLQTALSGAVSRGTSRELRSAVPFGEKIRLSEAGALQCVTTSEERAGSDAHPSCESRYPLRPRGCSSIGVKRESTAADAVGVGEVAKWIRRSLGVDAVANQHSVGPNVCDAEEHSCGE